MKKITLVLIIVLSILIGVGGGALGSHLLGKEKSLDVSFINNTNNDTITTRDYYIDIQAPPSDYEGIAKYSHTTIHFWGETKVHTLEE